MRLLLGLVTSALALVGCSPTVLVNAMVPNDGYVVERGLAYGERPRQRADVYLPDARSAGGQIVVFFYGGRWSDGDRGQYRFAAQALASRGFVVVVPDYRLYPQVRFPAFVEDGAQAVAWARERAGAWGADPDRLYLMGHSAGAHIGAMLTLDERFLEAVGGGPDWIAGFIGLAGPYDFLPLKARDLQEIFGPPDNYPVTQPINFVHGATPPPTLLIHGLDDGLVDPRNSRNLAAALRERGGVVETRFYKDEGHVAVVAALAAPLRFTNPVLEDVTAFIRDTPGLRASR